VRLIATLPDFTGKRRKLIMAPQTHTQKQQQGIEGRGDGNKQHPTYAECRQDDDDVDENENEDEAEVEVAKAEKDVCGGASRRFKSWEFARQPQKTCTQIIYNKNAKLSTRTQYRCTRHQHQYQYQHVYRNTLEKKGLKKQKQRHVENQKLSTLHSPESQKNTRQAAITSGETNGINDR